MEVDAVETVNQQNEGTRAAIVCDGEPLDSRGTLWTVSHLREADTIARITPAIQQGRCLRVRAGVKSIAAKGR